MVDDAGMKRKLAMVVPAIEAALKPQMEAYAGQVVAMMKSLAPVLQTPNKRRRAGALRDSIGWTWGAAPKGSMGIAAVRGAHVGKFITIYAGTRDKAAGANDAFYARFQEFGTSKMPASPYFYVSWRANSRRIKSGITRTVNKAVREIK